MLVLFYLIFLTFLVVLLGIFGVFWSIRNKQFDDLEGSAQRILMND